MNSPWGAAVSAVRTRPQGRVSVTFTQQGWEIRPCPVTGADLKVWFWWSFGASVAFSWFGFIPHALGAPKEVAFAFAAPGALLLAGLLIWGLGAMIVEVVATVLAFLGLLTRKGRRRLFGTSTSASDVPAGGGGPMVLPVHAVTGARVSHHWRRVVITVRMIDGVEFRYSRFGMRRARRTLEESFAGLLGPRLVNA